MNVVIYDVINAENKIRLREIERRSQIKDALKVAEGPRPRFSQRIQQFAVSLRGTKSGSQEQTEFHELLAGC